MGGGPGRGSVRNSRGPAWARLGEDHPWCELECDRDVGWEAKCRSEGFQNKDGSKKRRRCVWGVSYAGLQER